MSNFVKKTPPPPDIKEGEVVQAKIIDIQKVTSQWKNADGSDKEQLQFSLELSNGFPCRAWTAFYEHPSDKPVLGRLALMFESAIHKQFKDMNDFLAKLQESGYVFLKCKGFREHDGKLYPNFSLYTDKAPAVQVQTKQEAFPQ